LRKKCVSGEGWHGNQLVGTLAGYLGKEQCNY
jgi:hypothetical protein